MDERLDWLFRDGMAGLAFGVHDGLVDVEAYSAGGYHDEDRTEHITLSAEQTKQLRDWLVANVKD